MNKNQLDQQIIEAKDSVAKAHKQLKSIFEAELNKIFKEEKISSISIYISNFEWNDGDTPTYNVNYEDPDIEFNDDIELEDEDHQVVVNKIVDLFAAFGDSLESIFEQEGYETTEISFTENGKMNLSY